MARSMLTALLIVALPVLIRSQQPARGLAAPETSSHDRAILAGVVRAIDLKARYLESACSEAGKFAYRLDPYSGRL